MGEQSLDRRRVYAVAGAAGGLGPEVCRHLASDGASLSLADRSLESAQGVAESLGFGEDRLQPYEVDLLDPAATSAWAQAVSGEFGRCDGLIHLVGGWRGGEPIESFDLADYEFLHDLLVRTVQNTSRAFHSDLVSSDRGRFILVSSSVARRPNQTSAAYASAKAAAEAWILALADSFAGTGATANVLVVNAIVTAQMRADEPDKDFSTFTPTEEIADSIVYLCSEAASSMNGQRLDLFSAGS
jgi:NAD(P)-dependent dehydrogenase (short-subunit alcohol dehydrogenase family)